MYIRAQAYLTALFTEVSLAIKDISESRFSLSDFGHYTYILVVLCYSESEKRGHHPNGAF